MASYFNLRVSSATGERLKKHAKVMQRSANRLADECIEAICDLIEQHDRTGRNVPKIVVTADAAWDKEQNPVRLGPVGLREHAKATNHGAKYSEPEDEELAARIAEVPDKLDFLIRELNLGAKYEGGKKKAAKTA